MGRGRNVARKRKCCSGNQHTKTENVPTDPAMCSSAKKIKLIDRTLNLSADWEEHSYFMLCDFSVLKELIAMVGCCSDCGSNNIHIENVEVLRMGFANKLKLYCGDCLWEYSAFTSKECDYDTNNKKGGRKYFEVNVRSVVAFREIGRGSEAAKNFSRVMNMDCLNAMSFDNINNKIHVVYKAQAEESMSDAAKDIKLNNNNKIQGNTLCRVSLDGSWQRRGHASLNGLVTAISNNKCLDVAVFSKHCKGCAMWEHNKATNPVGYQTWQAEHECCINHQKSSGAMEGSGAVEIFENSIEKHSLIYNEYLGDGDTSSFKDVVNAEPYKDFGVIPKKLECVRHIQKRLGTRLRKLVKDHKSKDKKSLSGKGKLTEKVINSLQNYYGIAIRSNPDQLYAMKRSVGAILWHCTDFQNNEFRHRFCPRTPDSWCKWQVAKLKNIKECKPKTNIPKWIHDIIRPIFEDLSADELLSKCLHGQTQNVNESLNQLIWKRCPKDVFVGRKVLELGVYSAVLHYNDGAIGVEKVLNCFGIKNGKITSSKSEKKDIDRIKLMSKKSAIAGKKRRKHLRTVKKGYMDKEKESEKEESYIPGGF